MVMRELLCKKAAQLAGALLLCRAAAARGDKPLSSEPTDAAEVPVSSSLAIGV